MSNSLSGRSRPDLSKSLLGNQNGRKEPSTSKKDVIDVWESFVCPICNKKEIVLESHNRSYCSLSCAAKANIRNDNAFQGGYKEGSVKGHKSGWYKGEWYDSSWELAWAVFGEDHGIQFSRHPETFSYVFEESELIYHPDFYLFNTDVYVEIKNFVTKKDIAKWNDFPYDLVVLYEDQMRPILSYVESKFGDDFWRVFYE